LIQNFFADFRATKHGFQEARLEIFGYQPAYKPGGMLRNFRWFYYRAVACRNSAHYRRQQQENGVVPGANDEYYSIRLRISVVPGGKAHQSSAHFLRAGPGVQVFEGKVYLSGKLRYFSTESLVFWFVQVFFQRFKKGPFV